MLILLDFIVYEFPCSTRTCIWKDCRLLAERGPTSKKVKGHEALQPIGLFSAQGTLAKVS